jgi:hypothetical protein
MTMRMENTMKMMLKSAPALVLAALVACGGGGGSDSSAPAGNPNAATKLAYTDPSPTSTQWALKKNASSTSTHLVLDLVPPSDAVSGFGVGFTINAPTGVIWTKVAGTDAQMIHNTAYTLGGGTQLIKGISSNGNLIAGVYQQGTATAAVAHSSGAVASVALDLSPGASITASVVPTVSVSKELQLSGMQTITIAVGTIALQ